MEVFLARQMKELDRKAIREREISSVKLMETAARAVAEAALALCREKGETPRAVVFCGPGNNGGDGIAAARFLLEQGGIARVLLVGPWEKMTEDSREMTHRLAAAGGILERFDPEDETQWEDCQEANVMIDAIFGIGLRSAPRGDGAEAIRWMNGSAAPVIAADIPSGVSADTGLILETAVYAAQTVTFTRPKPGLLTGPGSVCCGKLTVAEIGIPQDLVEEVPCRTFLLTGEWVRARLPVRKADGHKGDFGKVGIAAGSVGFTGAPTLAAHAAARSGAGLVFLHVPESIYTIEAVKNTEAMVFPAPCDGGVLSPAAAEMLLERLQSYDACLIGPGFGQGDGARAVVAAAISGLPGPLVLDADGLNLLGTHIDECKARKIPVVLTPHEGEFKRLGGDSMGSDRISAARAFAEAYGCVLVLKGRGTVIACPDGTVYVNPTGNAGMAKGGSGDVLSGVILALLGQGMAPAEAAAAGVYLHGAAGDLCAARWGQRGMLPSDLITMLPRAFEGERRST